MAIARTARIAILALKTVGNALRLRQRFRLSLQLNLRLNLRPNLQLSLRQPLLAAARYLRQKLDKVSHAAMVFAGRAKARSTVQGTVQQPALMASVKQ